MIGGFHTITIAKVGVTNIRSCGDDLDMVPSKGVYSFGLPSPSTPAVPSHNRTITSPVGIKIVRSLDVGVTPAPQM
jgi:hypothetical protein